MRLHPLTLPLLSLPSVLAAYVQFKDCRDTDLASLNGVVPQLHADGLRALITPKNDGKTQLDLRVSFPLGEEPCDVLEKTPYTSSLEMAALGKLDRYETLLENQACNDTFKYPYFQLDFAYEIASPRLLDSYFLTLEVSTAEHDLLVCVRAPLTSDIGTSTARAITWGSISIFTLVVIGALWRETSALSTADQTDDDLGYEASRGHVTRVADSISYLQFVFFSSVLTLRYPGFLQPVASQVHWATLMFPAGVVVRNPWYPGVRDGLYAINGTFGGTYGMELMTQVMGGTITVDTWRNSMALAAMVLVVLLLVVGTGQRVAWTRDWFRGTTELSVRGSEDGLFSLKAVMWTGLRLFCSYFLLPLVAWTAYQLSYAAWVPIYHTLAAASTICVAILVIWWAMSQSSPSRMGYLLVDNGAQETQGQGQSSSSSSQAENIYATCVFGLLFLRGMAIGGLQFSGAAQLSAMIGAEMAQLGLFAFLYKTMPFFSRAGCIAVVRMAVLLLEVAFLPDVAGHSAKMAVGYVILGIHALVLVSLALIPALLDLFGLVKGLGGVSWDDDERPQTYGLRELARRPTNPTSRTSPSAPSLARSPSTLLFTEDRLPSSPHDRTSYYRQPRKNRSIASFSRISDSSSKRPLHQTGTPLTLDAFSSSSSTSQDSGQSWASETGEAHPAPSPLDPGVDYSTREADLYYRQPRRMSFRAETPALKPGLGSRISLSWGRFRKGDGS